MPTVLSHVVGVCFGTMRADALRMVAGEDQAGAIWSELWEGLWTIAEAKTDAGCRTLYLRRAIDAEGRLTARERHALALTVQGCPLKHIAIDLGMSLPTACCLVKGALARVGVTTRIDVAQWRHPEWRDDVEPGSNDVRSVERPRDLRGRRFEVDGREHAILTFPLPTLPADLSGRYSFAEAQVIHLVIAGRSNAAIARSRGTSVRTVANQLQSIYRKTKVTSRLELVRWLGQQRGT